MKIVSRMKRMWLVVAALVCASVAWAGNLASGTYYMKNVAAGKYLTGGNAWGTQASLGVHGLDIKAEVLENGKYTFDTNVPNSATNHYLGSNGYMDSSVAEWTLVEVAPQTYAITADGVNYIGYDGSTTVVNLALTDATSPAAHWEFITKDDLIADMASATATNPVDATFFIVGQGFNRGDTNRNTAWQGSPAIGGNNDNMAAEKWNCNFDIYQDLTGLPNGFYKLSAQGFYRAGNAGNTDLTKNAYLYANEVSSPMLNILAEAGNSAFEGGNVSAVAGYGNVPNNMATVSTAFSAGLYADNSVLVEVTDGTLRIGVKKETLISSDWTIFDNFELTYYGTKNPVDDETPEIGGFAYTKVGKYKIVGENLVVNGKFNQGATGLDGWTVTDESMFGMVAGGPDGSNIQQVQLEYNDLIDGMYQVVPVSTGGTYVVSFKVKGAKAGFTDLDLYLANSNYMNAYYNTDEALATAEGTNLYYGTNGVSGGYQFSFSDTDFTEAVFAVEAPAEGYIIIDFRSLQKGLQIADVECYLAEEVYDDRIARNRMEYFEKFLTESDAQQMEFYEDLMAVMEEVETAIGKNVSSDEMAIYMESLELVWAEFVAVNFEELMGIIPTTDGSANTGNNSANWMNWTGKYNKLNSNYTGKAPWSWNTDRWGHKTASANSPMGIQWQRGAGVNSNWNNIATLTVTLTPGTYYWGVSGQGGMMTLNKNRWTRSWANECAETKLFFNGDTVLVDILNAARNEDYVLEFKLEEEKEVTLGIICNNVSTLSANCGFDVQFYSPILYKVKDSEVPVEDASDENPIDVTDWLKSPSFEDANGNNSAEGWTGANGYLGSGVCEFYQKAFDIYQDLEGLPNGTYRIEVTAHERIGNHITDYGTAATEATTFLYGQAGADYYETSVSRLSSGAIVSKEVLGGFIQVETAESGEYVLVPNSIDAVKTAAKDYDKYQNVMYVKVTDGTLRLGMKKAAYDSYDWVFMDDWKLYYHGTNSQYAPGSVPSTPPVDDETPEVDGFAYTKVGKYKIVGENLVVNGKFNQGATGLDGWTVTDESMFGMVAGGPDGSNIQQVQLEYNDLIDGMYQVVPVSTGGTYVVSFKVKGAKAGFTDLDLYLANSNYMNAYYNTDEALATAEGTNLYYGTNGVSGGYQFSFSDTDFTEAVFAVEAPAEGYIIIDFRSLQKGLQIADVECYLAEEVYDDRIARNRMEYFEKFLTESDAQQMEFYEDLMAVMEEVETAIGKNVSSDEMAIYMESLELVWAEFVAVNFEELMGIIPTTDGSANTGNNSANWMNWTGKYNKLNSNYTGKAPWSWNTDRWGHKTASANSPMGIQWQRGAGVNSNWNNIATLTVTLTPGTYYWGVSGQGGMMTLNKNRWTRSWANECAETKLFFNGDTVLVDILNAARNEDYVLEFKLEEEKEVTLGIICNNVSTLSANCGFDVQFYSPILYKVKDSEVPVEDASDENPIDFTGWLKSPSFEDANGNNSADVWTGANGALGSGAYEFYQKAFDLYQDLTGLPNGTYRLEVSAYERIGSSINDYETYLQGADLATTYLYGQSGTAYYDTPIRRLASGAIVSDDAFGIDGMTIVGTAASGEAIQVPNNMYSAVTMFNDYGEYQNVMYVQVTDGTLRIGMKKDVVASMDWVMMDNWRLFYHGTNSQYAPDSVPPTPPTPPVDDEYSTANVLNVQDTEVFKGSTFTFPVSMTNENSISAFQCDVYLSDGLVLNLNDEDEYDVILNADRKTSSHSATASLQPDGAIRVIAYSSSNKLFRGNSGELFTLNLTALEGYAEDQTIEIRNIRLSTADEHEYLSAPISAAVTVKSYTPADANGDGQITIVDVVAVVNALMGATTGNFVFDAADMDQNGQITIVDVVAVVNALMGNNAQTLGARSILRSNLHVTDAEVNAGESTTLYVKLDNAQAYTAMQMDMNLPEGLTIEGVEMMGDASHTVTYNEAGRIAAYSLGNSRFHGGEALMAITVKADDSFTSAANVGFTNVRVVSTDVVETVLADALSTVIGGAKSIDGVEADENVQILYYSTTGAVSDAPHKGLNIIKRIYEDGRVEVNKIMGK